MKKNITLKDLVMQVDKEQVLTYLMENYTVFEREEFSTEAVYKKGSKMFRTLRTMEPVPCNDLKLSVWHGLTEDKHAVGYDVSGYGYSEEFGWIYFGIGGMPWSECLGMVVCKDTLEELSPLQIVGYAMYEMSFYGWAERK